MKFRNFAYALWDMRQHNERKDHRQHPLPQGTKGKSEVHSSLNADIKTHDENLISTTPLPPCCAYATVARPRLDTCILVFVSTCLWEYEWIKFMQEWMWVGKGKLLREFIKKNQTTKPTENHLPTSINSHIALRPFPTLALSYMANGWRGWIGAKKR